jgi:hypothetical protein
LGDFIGELLVVLATLLGVGHILLKGALGILIRQGGQAVTVQGIHEINIPAVGKSVLRDHDVLLTVAGLVQQFGNPSGTKPPRKSQYNLSMPISEYLHQLREKVGHALLVLPSAAVALYDEQGRVLGSHAGVHRFTVGQRKGLGLAAQAQPRRSGGAAEAGPMYVLALRPEQRQVIVGPKTSLEQTRLTASGVNWIAEEPAGALRVAVQIRHHHQAAPASVRALGDARAEVIFDTPQLAIAPGQAVVFYDGDKVVGGGWID